MAKTHASLSPSAAHRWLVCSGEPALRAKMPNNSSSYATEGTTAHWVAEQCLQLEREPISYVGKVCPETNESVTADMAEAVKVFVDYCRSVSGQWNRVETKFKLPELSDRLGGTADFASVNGTVLNVPDYKHGKGYAVSAEGNPQLRIYALGAYEALKAERPELAEKITSVLPGIVQPRAEGDAIKLEKLLLSELLEWRDKVLKPAIKRTETETDSYVAGEHCRFCPAKAVCPAQYRRNLEVAQIDFAKPVAVAPPAPQTLTVPQLARVLQAADDLKSWLGAVEEHAQALLEKGTPVPGFKLVKKRSNRAWKDEKVAETALLKVLGVGAYKPREVLSVAKAEELLKVFGVALSAELVIKPDTGNVIAPMSDKRAAVSAQPAALDFLRDADFLS